MSKRNEEIQICRQCRQGVRVLWFEVRGLAAGAYAEAASSTGASMNSSAAAAGIGLANT